MEKPTSNRTKWFQLGVLVALVITVGFLAVMIFRLETRLNALGRQGEPDESVSPAVAVTPQPGHTDEKSDEKHVDSYFPFDPNNWDPFAEMQQMQKEIDHLFDDSFNRFGKSQRFSDLVQHSDFSPKIDMTEEKDDFVIRVDLPGVKESSVDVKVDGREVQISGRRDNVVTDKDKEGHVIRQERHTGSFSRFIELPETVDPNRMTTKNDKGVFTIVLPKA